MLICPIIVAGGSGSRLWPVSREANPKPFIKMEDGLSLLQKTFLRAKAAGGVESVTTVTNRELFFRTEDEYRELSPSMPLHYLLEPFGRNTAPAVCGAALELQARYGDEALMLVLPADHLVKNEAAFAQAVAMAAEAAAEGHLVSFGIQPTHAETGFGYIEVPQGSDIAANQVLDVERFVEKPSRELAEQYLAGGRHLWNSGMFCFRVGTLMDELNIHAPELVHSVMVALEASSHSEGEGHTVTRLMPETFGQVVDDSIDYALMEKSERVAVVPCDLGWSDIGSWQAMADLVEPDETGNRVVGAAELEDCHNTYIRSPHRLTAAVGAEDLVIVDTADALLVAHKDRSQDVKKIVQRLKANGNELHQHHVTVHRPWGTYTVLEEGEGFKMKRIEVKPSASLSLQMHHHRSEHWIVVRGTAKVVNGDQEILLCTNESTYIPAGHQHRLENPGIMQLVMIEVQSGDYLGEDDIVQQQPRRGSILSYLSQHDFSKKAKFSPDFLFEGEEVSFFYTYIRKNASTSFKKLFQVLYPGACSGDIPSIGCMIEHARLEGVAPEEVDQRFATKLFVYRDPVDRVFSTYKNKVIQQDGAEDLLRRLENVVERDPALLTFDEFVHEYVVLLETERWEEVDGHLYPQVWHLLPITYNKVIRMDNVYQEMREILPDELCDKVFKEPSNSTTKGSVPLPWADPDCPAVYFRKKYAEGKALPTLKQLLTPATEARLREVYAEDYQMIAEVEGKPLISIPAHGLEFDFPTTLVGRELEKSLGLDFSLPEDRR